MKSTGSIGAKLGWSRGGRAGASEECLFAFFLCLELRRRGGRIVGNIRLDFRLRGNDTIFLMEKNEHYLLKRLR